MVSVIKFKGVLIKSVSVVLGFLLLGCNLSDHKDKIRAVIDEPPKKNVPVEKLGLNAFFNDSRFGSLAFQINDVVNNLRINRLRILLRWDDFAHPSRDVKPAFSLMNDILSNLPSNVKVLVITTGTPSWMKNHRTWVQGDPVRTFIDLWFTPFVEFIARFSQVEAIQIWNEPNDMAQPENQIMNFSNPENYLRMLSMGAQVIRSVNSRIKVVNAATTAVNQRGHNALEYNKKLISLGAHHIVDVWAFHYYGRQFERFFQNGGVKDVVERVGKRVWITESGEQGVDKQLDYAQRVWPFLFENLKNLERIYVYQYTENSPPDRTYGLRNLSSRPFSDLYQFLAERH